MAPLSAGPPGLVAPPAGVHAAAVAAPPLSSGAATSLLSASPSALGGESTAACFSSLQAAAGVAAIATVASKVQRRSRLSRRKSLAVATTATAAGASDASATGSAPSLVAVARGDDIRSVPVWLFRQAGRHLPEYRDYKEKRQKNFLEMLDDPQDVAEITMQPLRRYDLDAGILFSDILVVPQALGVRVEMPGGKGILVPEPYETPADLGKLPALDEVADPAWVRSKLSHVMEAVRAILAQMKQEKREVPLIGFSAAPWTLMFYMVGGSSRKNTDVGERWLKQHPAESQKLLDLLTTVVIEYMSAQVENGCSALQVFEAMCDFISEENFNAVALPVLQRIAKELKQRHPDIPLMAFARGAGYAHGALQRAGYDVVTIDCTMTLKEAEDVLVAEADRAGTPPTGHLSVLQGNLDPVVLRPAEGITVHTVEDAAREMLRYRGLDGEPRAKTGLIANLGAGLMGTEDPALVDAFVNSVHKISAELAA
eukprot:TRINITY_DN121689_c0_g1_i1.p1 TRINITY_DN121689_c0_g1~~TRINITY_DN121689_c0_g1_i1.p1  ORF type:complete len:484 (+),score=133.38 TRINITY_DN121689_c0_g1_i1:62-1513(+)